jgi:hypothetical protein
LMFSSHKSHSRPKSVKESQLTHVRFIVELGILKYKHLSRGMLSLLRGGK